MRPAAPALPLSVVVVTYNSDQHVGRCLGSLSREDAETIVVDNASQGADARVVSEEFPDVRLIELPRNVGFARAANIGVREAGRPWVLLLNPDAWPTGDALRTLLEFCSGDASLAAAGPALVGLDGRPKRSTLRAPLSAPSLALWAALPASVSGGYSTWRWLARPQLRAAIARDEFLQGAALIVRADAFREMGGFDEDFFMYGEDADLCERFRAAGWRVGFCRAARFVHVGGGSTRSGDDRTNPELLRSWLRLIAKRYGLGRARRARRWLIGGLRLRGILDPAARTAAGRLASQPLDQLLEAPRE